MRRHWSEPVVTSPARASRRQSSSLPSPRRPGGGCARFGRPAAITSRRSSGSSSGRGGRAPVGTSPRHHVQEDGGVIGWPVVPSPDWQLGFLAGIFDAEGGCSGGVLRISNTDPVILRQTESCLRALGFQFVTEDQRRPNGMTTIRVLGGLRERLRFFHTTHPAITRKRQSYGAAVKGTRRGHRVWIEPLGLTIPMYDITPGTGDFIANGVISHNCFARNTHTYLDFDAG